MYIIVYLGHIMVIIKIKYLIDLNDVTTFRGIKL